ncbi:MAG: hypothetical protein R3F24_09680 [Gammaproteobacteria bacterium]
MRLFSALLGLILGVLAGTALLLANPLTWFSGLAPLPDDIASPRAYSWEDFRGMDGGVADLLGLDLAAGSGPNKEHDNAQRAFRKPALAGVRTGIVVLPAGDGSPAALAVKVSTIDSANNLWRAQLGTDDYWNIFWPGEGSVFAAGYSNLWPLARDRFLPFGQQPEPGTDGAGPFALSAPEPTGGWTGVIGAAGRYAGYTGEIREWLSAPDTSPASGRLNRALALKVIPPPVVAR